MEVAAALPQLCFLNSVEPAGAAETAGGAATFLPCRAETSGGVAVFL